MIGSTGEQKEELSKAKVDVEAEADAVGEL
jgi:hypothetical protein